MQLRSHNSNLEIPSKHVKGTIGLHYFNMSLCTHTSKSDMMSSDVMQRVMNKHTKNEKQVEKFKNTLSNEYTEIMCFALNKIQRNLVKIIFFSRDG